MFASPGSNPQTKTVQPLSDPLHNHLATRGFIILSFLKLYVVGFRRSIASGRLSPCTCKIDSWIKCSTRKRLTNWAFWEHQCRCMICCIRNCFTQCYIRRGSVRGTKTDVWKDALSVFGAREHGAMERMCTRVWHVMYKHIYLYILCYSI